ncbi:hypothetical protein FRC19_003940, partial [Serendipita sp. 401]
MQSTTTMTTSSTTKSGTGIATTAPCPDSKASIPPMAATTSASTDPVVEPNHNTESPTTSTSTPMGVATAENSTQSAFATQRSKVLK